MVHFLDRVSALDGHVAFSSQRIASRVQGLVEHLGRLMGVVVFHAEAGNLVQIGLQEDDFEDAARLCEAWFETPIKWQGKGFRDLRAGDGDFLKKLQKSDRVTTQIHFGKLVNISISVNLYAREEDKTSSADNKNADLRFIRGELQEKLETPGLNYVKDFLGSDSAQAVTFPIDIVYTWVNDEDPDWQEIYAVAKAEREAEFLIAQELLVATEDTIESAAAELSEEVQPLDTAEPIIFGAPDAFASDLPDASDLPEEPLTPAPVALKPSDEGEGDFEEATDTAALSRFRSRDELKYSLRSVEQYMPWVRKIFIFSNCAKPRWLGETDNVVWVDHSEVIPEKHLPTFNSHAIESYLHKIPDLSEHFIYFNDDFFVNQPLPVRLFYTANGVAQSNLEDYGVVNGMQSELDADYLNAARNGAELIRREFGMSPTRLHKHSPYAMSKSVMAEMEKKFKKDFERTRLGKFRSPTDLSTASFLFHHYGYATRAVAYGGFRAKLVKNTARNLEGDFKMMTEGTTVRTFCLNDGNDSHDDERWNDMICDFLANRFPIPTRAEMGMKTSDKIEVDTADFESE